jgi:Skp family chaperone for outer membrane proteins
VIVVDMPRVLREVEIARALRVIELEARRALRASLDAVKVSLEAEEAELVQLRKTLPKDQFDARVRAFDQRVRAERQDAQDKGAALQARFTSARSALEAAIRPVLAGLMRERGAVVALDRSAVLVVADPQEATDELIARINAARPASGAPDLVPPTAPPQ